MIRHGIQGAIFSLGEPYPNPLRWWGFSTSFSTSESRKIRTITGLCEKIAKTRDRIRLPPAESLSLGGLYLRGSRTPAFRAGFEAAFSARSAESCRARKHRADPQQYLCRAIFQYRISRDAVATSCWVKVAGRVPKRDRACSGLRDAGGSCEFGLRSSKAERCPLIVPGKRQT